MMDEDEASLKKLIVEQLINNAVYNNQQQQDQPAETPQLAPLTTAQIDKKAEDITNRFSNNIFNSVKDSLDEYYDDVADILNKNVKLKELLTSDLKMYVTKVINSAMKQTTGNEKEEPGGNKTYVNNAQ